MKKILSIFTSCILLLSLCSCTFYSEPNSTDNKPNSSNEQTDIYTKNNNKIDNIHSQEIISKKDLNDIIDIESGSTNKRDGIADIVEKIAESVVSINVYGTVRDYFNRTYPTEGAGSGVIISSDGYIITNNHVITGGDKITVFLSNGKSYEGEVIGADKKSDLALLKINASNLTNAKIGNSHTLRRGDFAIAIGNPLGELSGSVSFGIISALNRRVNINGNELTLIQIDAAVNPGNSGGGLFDSNGELIGIVTAKKASENVEGLGFAIPIDTTIPIISDLLSHGYVTGRPALGIETIFISSSYSAIVSGVYYKGVYVYNVHTGSTAEKAGLKKADFIQSLDGTQINTEEQFWNLIETKKVGQQIELEILRGNNSNPKIIKCTIEEAH